jgi:hypothetical protein
LTAWAAQPHNAVVITVSGGNDLHVQFFPAHGTILSNLHSFPSRAPVRTGASFRQDLTAGFSFFFGKIAHPTGEALMGTIDTAFNFRLGQQSFVFNKALITHENIILSDARHLILLDSRTSVGPQPSW